MTSPSSTGRAWIAYVLLPVTLAVTAAAAFLLVPGNYRDGKFGLSLGAILLTECLLFAVPAWIRSHEKSSALPVHFTQNTLVWLYAGVVFYLVRVAFTDVSLNVLWVLHLLALLGLLLGLGVTHMAAGRIAGSSVAQTARQAGFRPAQEQFECLADRIQSLPGADFAPLKQSFRRMRDDLRYVSSETLPGAEDVENEFRDCLRGLDELVSALEAGTPSDRAADTSAKLQMRFEQLQLVLRRREERLSRLC